MKKLVDYITDVIAELKKVVWPSKDILVSSTIVVIIISLLFSIYILGVDKILNHIIGLILKK